MTDNVRAGGRTEKMNVKHSNHSAVVYVLRKGMITGFGGEILLFSYSAFFSVCAIPVLSPVVLFVVH